MVPRVHVGFLEDLDEDLGARVFRTGHRLARALRRSGLPCEWVNMFLADGEAAFQEVFLVHLHVFPRTAGDGFVIDARWRLRDREELDASAEQVPRHPRFPPDWVPLLQDLVSDRRTCVNVLVTCIT